MKFQKFPIFHLWVCVTDSPGCVKSILLLPELKLKTVDLCLGTTVMSLMALPEQL